MDYIDLVESIVDELTETKIKTAYQSPEGHLVTVAKGGSKVFQGGSRVRTARMKLRPYKLNPKAGEDWEDVPLGANLTIDKINASKEQKEDVSKIVDGLLNEAGIQKLVFKSAADAEEAAAARAFANAQKRAAGEDPRKLYSDPQKDLELNPLKKAHMERLNFLRDSVEKRSTPVKGGTSRQPIGDRVIRSMQDEIGHIESELGLSGRPAASAEGAKRAFADLFSGEDKPVRSSGAAAFQDLFTPKG